MRTESFSCDGPYCIECGYCMRCHVDDPCKKAQNGEHTAPTIVGAEVSEG